MRKPRILVQLDPDPQPSLFDSVVAVDSQVDHLLRYSDVTAEQVQGIVHGAMFTRGPSALKHTAIFIGGANVDTGAVLLEQVTSCFFGPMRVSVMLDANGANTTAAAAVIAASRHVDFAGTTIGVLGGTGPVGQRIVRLLANNDATVRVGSRKLERAQAVVDSVGTRKPTSTLTACVAGTPGEIAAMASDCDIIFSAGAAGIELLGRDALSGCKKLRVAIDLNAVPPLGIAGTEMTDRAQQREGVIYYGAIGVGGTKMKIHRAAIQSLFDSNDRVLDAEEIYEIAVALEGAK